MALGDSYVSATELGTYLQITGSDSDGLRAQACAAASREVELFCHRQFNLAASATARVYRTSDRDWYDLDLDDIGDTSGLVVKADFGGDGTYETTWVNNTDFLLTPFDGVKDGVAGWPYERMRMLNKFFPPNISINWRPLIQVTAKWGWAAVPAPVKTVTYQLAAREYQLKGAPFGVQGFEAGVVRIRDLDLSALTPYVRQPALVA